MPRLPNYSSIKSKILWLNLCLSGLLFSITTSSFALTVKHATPLPNYQLTKNDTDLQELSDGLIYRHPAWTQKGSVGWINTSTIQLDMALDGVIGNSCHTGTLKIITAKKERAKVKLPRRIDVYGGNNHLQELSIDDANYADDSPHTLAVELSNVTSQISLIIHASGPYVMIDEIAWEPKQDCPAEFDHIVTQGKIVDPLKDSQQRLLNQLTVKAIPSVDQHQPFSIWFDEPWGALSTMRPNLNLSLENISRNIVGSLGDKQFAVLGLSGACEPGQHYTIRAISSSSIVDKLRFFKVKEQLAFDGSNVYDPLIPIHDALPCPESPINTYLWVEMPLKTQATALTETVSIEVKATNGDIRTADIHVSANNLSKVESCKLNAVNWAYSFDLPIWKVTTKAYDDLTTHGINVFVVPPRSLSLPKLDGKPAVLDAAELWNQISPALDKNPNAQFLLFMALDKWLATHQQQPEAELAKSLSNWVKTIEQIFSSKGLAKSQWALYPIDEPIGPKLSKLEWSTLLIRGVNPEIKIYTNPIAASRNSVSEWQLKELQDKIDIFQPSVRLVQEQLPFFQNLNKPWWLYENPQSPAKSALPAFYRALGIQAWSLGASGIGFWSYSDTGKSSAWDDFDSKRPDWAVVYEDAKTIISSRRWEAFTKGINDYRLLCHAEKKNKDDRTLFELRQSINENLNNPGIISRLLDTFINNNIGKQ